jgi:hypothetical protein
MNFIQAGLVGPSSKGGSLRKKYLRKLKNFSLQAQIKLLISVTASQQGVGYRSSFGGEVPIPVAAGQSLLRSPEFFPVRERLDYFRSKPWHGLIRMEGPRIYVGLDPVLVASKVNDLRTERDTSTGDEIVRWTQPPGLMLGPVGSPPKQSGEPIEKIFRISDYGVTISAIKSIGQ